MQIGRTVVTVLAVMVAGAASMLATPSAAVAGHPAVAAGELGSLGLVPVTGDAVPAPPPTTSVRGVDGTVSAEPWRGPYTFRNFHSNKCLDILGASSANGAAAVQYRCVAGGKSQMWWIRTAAWDSQTAIVQFFNNWSGKCLQVGGLGRGAAVIQNPCSDTAAGSFQWWCQTIDRNTWFNYETGYYMEVNGGSAADFARIVVWTYHGRAHQVWLRYNA